MGLKDTIRKFFSNKMNIALIVVQVVAIIMYFISSTVPICGVFFLILEGVFLILFGINFFLGIRKIRRCQETYSQLPYTQEQIEMFVKRDSQKIKSYRFTAYVLIIVGAFLILNLIFVV